MAFSERNMFFDGTNDYTGHGNVLAYEYNSAFSVSVWLQCVPHTGYVVSKQGGASLYRGWALYLHSSGFPYLWLCSNYNGGGASRIDFQEAGDVIVADGNWNHLIVTHDGAGNVTMYKNGISMTTTNVQPWSQLVGNTIVSASENFNISGRNDGQNYEYSGYLDDVGIYSKVLTQADATWMNALGEPRDLQDASAPTTLTSYFKFDGDTWSTVTDSQGTNNGTVYNGSSTSSYQDRGALQSLSYRGEYNDASAVSAFNDDPANADGIIKTYKMSAKDSNGDRVYWVITGNSPDFDGDGYANASPAPVGAMQAGSAENLSEL